MFCVYGKPTSWHTLFSVSPWLLFFLAALFFPGFQCRAESVSSGDPVDESFGGFEGDEESDAVVVELGVPDALGNYTQDVNLFVDAQYYLSQDGVAPYSSVGYNSAEFDIRNIPSGATVSGTINVFFSGDSHTRSVDPGFVYNYVFTPPLAPSVTSTGIATTSDLVSSCRTTATAGGMVLFNNINSRYENVGQGGSIPVLSDHLSVNVSQEVAVSYRITNTASYSQTITIKVNGYTAGQLALVKQASLASLYSAAGVDYTDILQNINSTLGDFGTWNGQTVNGALRSQNCILGDYATHNIETINGRIYAIMTTIGGYEDTSINTVNGVLRNIFSTLMVQNDYIKSINTNISSQGDTTRGLLNVRFADILSALQNLTTGYDSSAASAAKDKLDSSLSGLDAVQDQAYQDASSTLDGFDIGSQLAFTDGLVSGLSFITSVVNSFLGASGDFSVAVSVLYVLAFLSMLLGVWRFANK